MTLRTIDIERRRAPVLTDTGMDPAFKTTLVAGGPDAGFYAGHPVSAVAGEPSSGRNHSRRRYQVAELAICFLIGRCEDAASSLPGPAAITT